ncbi:ATP-binding protein [Anaerostipes sp.]|uniref:ATP-binding protein n=1 Tax=Anaerostipes sp. TaxID=1872530 RepID=UPI0025C5B5DE|nr:ATP-binding protein [Anaerostipes sp.]MBS7009859.1 response regulator [Anaerostipes sp.]
MEKYPEEMFYKNLYDNLTIGLMQFIQKGNDLSLLHINDFGCKILNYDKTSGRDFDFHSFIDKLSDSAYREFILSLNRLKKPGEFFSFTRPIYVGQKKSWLQGVATRIASDDGSRVYQCVFSDSTSVVEQQIQSENERKQEIKILNELCTLIVSRSYETLGLLDVRTGHYRFYAVQPDDWFTQHEMEGDFDELTSHVAETLGYEKEDRLILRQSTLSGIVSHLQKDPDSTYTSTYRIKTHSSYRWKRAEYNYLKDDKTKIIFSTQDIHEEKMEEERLSNIADRERQIHQDKMAFFANMSHEIRTPMNAILNLSELLLRKELPNDIERDISTIYTIGNNLLGIINSLLSFSKLDSGKIDLNNGSYSPSALISDVCNMIMARLIKKNIYFFTDINPQIPRRLIGDEMRIREILTNLLANAVKFTASGKIELKADYRLLNNGQKELILSVSDTGSGIPKTELPNLFSQFNRADMKKNQTIMGTGLGLAISKKLTELMGGEITVESEYGKGSTFSVHFPQKIYSSGDLLPPSDKFQLANIYLLIPDTDSTLIRYLIRELKKLGIRPSLVSSVSAVIPEKDRKSYLIMRQTDFTKHREQADDMFPSDHVILLMKNDETLVSEYYNYHQVYPFNFLMQTANILNGQAVKHAPEKVRIYESVTFPEARLLIVDDNEVNSSVAKRLMEPYQMEIDLASNGFEALEMIAHTHYDLVFLDHMMPGMDGVETVQKIRTLEKSRHLPVIALTANVFSDADTYFKEKGFTGFLAKPINVKELHDTLLAYLSGKAVEQTEKSSSVCTAKTSPELMVLFKTLKHFDTETALAYFDQSADFYIEMLRTFYQGLYDRRNEMDSICRQQNTKLFTIHVHAIKSASKSVGAADYSETAKVLEDFGHQQDWKAISARFDEFIQETDIILTELESFLSALPSAARNKEKRSNFPADAVKDLCIAVNEMDYQRASEAISVLDHYCYPHEMQHLLDRLKTAYDNFEYSDLNRYSALIYNCL